MKVQITPIENKRGPIEIPSSKSLGHRAILCASLSKGISHIRNLNFSSDIEATIEAVKELGAKVFCELPRIRINFTILYSNLFVNESKGNIFRKREIDGKTSKCL